MTDNVSSVSVTYARNGSSTKSNEKAYPFDAGGSISCSAPSPE